MERKIKFFSLILLIVSGTLSAQTNSLVTSTVSYDTLSNVTIMDESSPDTSGGFALYKAIPIGFTYSFQGMDFDSLSVADDGFIILSKDDTNRFWISVYDCDMKDFQDNSTLSPILYKTEGSMGNRIFKLEYRNSGFTYDLESDDYTNAQLWLYESCDAFEIKLGPRAINSVVFWGGYYAPIIGYGNYINFAVSYLQGDPAAPIVQSGWATLLDSPPVANTNYNFSVCNTDVAELDRFQDFDVYPNPSSGVFTIKTSDELSGSKYRVINVQGQIILRGTVPPNPKDISIYLPGAGIYFFQITGPGGQGYSRKLIRL